MKKLILTLLTFGLMGLYSTAQNTWDSNDTWDDSGDSWDKNGDANYDYDPGSGSGVVGTDTGAVDSWGDDDDSWGGDDSGFDYGSGGTEEYVRSARPKVEAKPYERFTGMPYDTAAELVTYVEIIEVIVPDEYLGDDYSISDSLYARAKVWMNQQFGEKEAKKMIEEAGEDIRGREGQTIKAIAVMPLIVEVNKYAKTTAGVLQFDMELRFKDGRYRYKFNNFVHVTPNTSGGKDEVRTYMEYYMTAKKDVKSNDRILMATNNQMNRIIDDLRKSCNATPFIDDDDW